MLAGLLTCMRCLEACTHEPAVRSATQLKPCTCWRTTTLSRCGPAQLKQFRPRSYQTSRVLFGEQPLHHAANRPQTKVTCYAPHPGAVCRLLLPACNALSRVLGRCLADCLPGCIIVTKALSPSCGLQDPLQTPRTPCFSKRAGAQAAGSVAGMQLWSAGACTGLVRPVLGWVALVPIPGCLSMASSVLAHWATASHSLPCLLPDAALWLQRRRNAILLTSLLPIALQVVPHALLCRLHRAATRATPHPMGLLLASMEQMVCRRSWLRDALPAWEHGAAGARTPQV